MRSNVKIWKNGNLIRKGHNAVGAGVRTYLIGLTNDATTNKCLDSLFQTDELAYGGAEDGNDGVLAGVDGTYRTMGSTTFVSATNTYAFKIRVEYTNTSGSEVTLSDFILGHNFNGASSFDTQYAIYNPTNIDLGDQDTLVLQWEVYVSS